MAKNYNVSSLQKLAFHKFALKMLILVLILDIQSTQTQENIENGDNPLLSEEKETKRDQNILFSLTSFTDEPDETVEINEQLDTVYNEYFQESIINEEFMLMKFTIYSGDSVTRKNLQNVILTYKIKLTSIDDKKNIEIKNLIQNDDEINEFKKVIDRKIDIEFTSNIKGINLLEIIKKENEKDKQKIDFNESLDDTFYFNKNHSAKLKKPLQIFNIYCNQTKNDSVIKKYLENFFKTIDSVLNGDNFKFFNVTIFHKINIETSKLTNPRCKTDIKFNTIVNISETDKKYYLCFVSAHGTFFMMKSHQSKFTGNFMELN